MEVNVEINPIIYVEDKYIIALEVKRVKCYEFGEL